MRLIDANALSVQIAHMGAYDVLKSVDFDMLNAFERVRAAMYSLIKNAPIIDAVEVVHGRWIEVGSYDEDGYYDVEYKCSVCGRFDVFDEPYCHCGAKMDGKEG